MSTAGASVDVADEVRAELTELADALDGLSAADWDRSSLCSGWRVREVVAHVTLPALRSKRNVLFHLVRNGFRWNRVADRLARQDAQRPVAELVAALRSERLQSWRPPGGREQGALVHAVVHGLDVTLPLGIDRRFPPERLRVVLDGLSGRGSLAHFGTDIRGKQLVADDVNWSFGSGSAVHANAETLILAMSGRRPLPAPA